MAEENELERELRTKVRQTVMLMAQSARLAHVHITPATFIEEANSLDGAELVAYATQIMRYCAHIDDVDGICHAQADFARRIILDYVIEAKIPLTTLLRARRESDKFFKVGAVQAA